LGKRGWGSAEQKCRTERCCVGYGQLML
jgi:hypothetical protein